MKTKGLGIVELLLLVSRSVGSGSWLTPFVLMVAIELALVEARFFSEFASFVGLLELNLGSAKNCYF